jgi:hypothetical protein
MDDMAAKDDMAARPSRKRPLPLRERACQYWGYEEWVRG